MFCMLWNDTLVYIWCFNWKKHANHSLEPNSSSEREALSISYVSINKDKLDRDYVLIGIYCRKPKAYLTTLPINKVVTRQLEHHNYCLILLFCSYCVSHGLLRVLWNQILDNCRHSLHRDVPLCTSGTTKCLYFEKPLTIITSKFNNMFEIVYKKQMI